MLIDRPRTWPLTVLLGASIAAGVAIGVLLPSAGEALGAAVDPLVLLLVAAIVFALRFDGVAGLRGAPRTVLAAVGVNFLVVPVVALLLSRVVPDEALRLGVLVYCLAPCTDWFLGFIRLAGGDTRAGAALIPVQMGLQLALYPFWLALFAGEQAGIGLGDALGTMLTWFALPAGAALLGRALLRIAAARAVRDRVIAGADAAAPFVIAALIVCLFAANVGVILEDARAFGWVLLVVFLFFLAIFAIGEGVTRGLRLEGPAATTVVMTTSARNAPMMIGLTAVALPDQPAVVAAIAIGMLVEFPHLTALTALLRRRARRRSDAGSLPGDRAPAERSRV